MYLLKMIFFADRYHLRHFGITATDDTYFAMKHGPVASSTCDILKNNPYNVNTAELSFFSAVKPLSEFDVSIEKQDEDELSESFKEALDFALKEFGNYKSFELSGISHCYPEWKRHESDLAATARIQMDAIDFFDDPADEACFKAFNMECDPFKDDKEYLSLRKEHYNAYHISR
jgi:uncharacterized phage-associated protein